jgi:phenylalanyl-tRNA synthetase alpha chain
VQESDTQIVAQPGPAGEDVYPRPSAALHPNIENALQSTNAAQDAFADLQQLDLILGSERQIALSLAAVPAEDFSERLLAALRVRFFGKKSRFQNLLTQLRSLPADARKEAGARINAAKQTTELDLEALFLAVGNQLEESRLLAEVTDISLTLPPPSFGSRHPVSVVTRELLAPLIRMGFVVADGPEIESDFYNFEALNLPPDHPAREMQDTLFLQGQHRRASSGASPTNGAWLLRTHTSSVQVHALLERKAPLRIACPGYTYRNEYDLTHIPTFRQIEGLVIDKGIHFGHLRHTLNTFFNEVFGREVRMRFRSSYFPFTEPSAEMDVQCQQCMGAGCRACKGTGWIEMGGCGMVHRKVLAACDVPEGYSGFAFGMGIDRIAMTKFGIADLRALTDGDVNYLSQFRLR